MLIIRKSIYQYQYQYQSHYELIRISKARNGLKVPNVIQSHRETSNFNLSSARQTMRSTEFSRYKTMKIGYPKNTNKENSPIKLRSRGIGTSSMNINDMREEMENNNSNSIGYRIKSSAKLTPYQIKTNAENTFKSILEHRQNYKCSNMLVDAENLGSRNRIRKKIKINSSNFSERSHGAKGIKALLDSSQNDKPMLKYNRSIDLNGSNRSNGLLNGLNKINGSNGVNGSNGILNGLNKSNKINGLNGFVLKPQKFIDIGNKVKKMKNSETNTNIQKAQSWATPVISKKIRISARDIDVKKIKQS